MAAGAGALLTLNAGSSSIKYALFDDALQPLRRGQVDGLGMQPGERTHEQALRQVLDGMGRLSLKAVGHRVVHGGTRFAGPVRVDEEVEAAIEALAPLAPLHQPHNLAGVRAARATFAGVPQVACFDTAFHRSMPEVHQRFALPQALHDAGVRRYGFHGLSYESIAGQLAADEPLLAGARVVVAHLGNGASMCALRGGRSLATTMSFSPLDGLTMGTRCGRLDAGAVLHLLGLPGASVESVSGLLHRHSGLLGLSGLASDMRTLLACGQPAAQLAIEHFVESARREIAGLAAALGGLDGLVFTGGIGENAAGLRARIVDGLAWMGVQLDAAANARGADAPGPGVVNAAASRVQVRVLRTQEEAVIARQAAQVVADA